MIIEEEIRDDVQVGGAKRVDAFTIKASAKAFQILSSNLYSNPLGSMVRELSTNAYDAHVMTNKKDIPFTIKLPNSLDPTFKIRDFGPGLSEKEIYSVYTTFFESTKTNSNDVVGCLGLGSKSPFGVADSFTITSFNNGTKAIYSSFLNDERIPSVAHFHSEPSDEPNGLELEIAVKEDDINTFANEVNTQLKYFTVKPTITGNSNFEWKTNEEYIYEGNRWKMVSANNYGRARVVQGQIAYPIDTSAMGTKYNEASQIVRQVLDMNILFEVNIGEVNIAPSREALSYDEATVDNLLSHAQTIVDELPVMVIKAIHDSKTEWKARLKYQDVIQTLGGSHSAMSNYMAESGKILWKKKDVSSLQIKIPEQYMVEFRYFDKTYSGKFKKHNQTKSKDWHSNDDTLYWNISVREDKQILFYAEPGEKAVDARVKQYMNDNHNERYSHPYIMVSEKSYRALKSKLGNPDIIKTASLDKVRRNITKKVKGAPTEITVQSFFGGGWNKSDKWETETYTGQLTDIEGFYVELDRHDAVYEGKKYSDFSDYVSATKSMKLYDGEDTIYGLRATNMKKPHNLKCFITYIKEEFAKSTQVLKYTYGDWDSVVSKIANEHGMAKNILKELDTDSFMKPLLEAIIHNNSHSASYAEQKMLNAFSLEIPTISLAHLSKQADSKYYMIAEAGYYINATKCLRYIGEMDLLATLTETDVDVVSGFIKENTKVAVLD